LITDHFFLFSIKSPFFTLFPSFSQPNFFLWLVPFFSFLSNMPQLRVPFRFFSFFNFLGFGVVTVAPTIAKQYRFFTTLGPSRFTTPMVALLANHGLSYPTPANISYFWGFGSLSGLCLGLQLLSGIFLAMHYQAGADQAFASVEHIMRDVQGG
jgi:hypothetical protein